MNVRRATARQERVQKRGRVLKESQIGVRVSGAMRAFLKRRAIMKGVKEAAEARLAMEIYKDLIEGLGDDWWEIARRASTYEQGPGAIIAQAVKAALELERKAKK